MTPADSLDPVAYAQVSYNDPDVGLDLVRYELASDTARFDAALRTYIRRWTFKHPTPADFFRTMDEGLGQDLSWFWRGWFYHTDSVDQGVDPDRTGRRLAHVFLANRGALPMPVRLRLTFAGGHVQDIRLPVDIWRSGDRYRYETPAPADLLSVVVDPLDALPDVQRANNSWHAAARKGVRHRAPAKTHRCPALWNSGGAACYYPLLLTLSILAA